MLAEYGGCIPDGRPVWRMVLAQNVRIRATGIMRHAPKLSAAVDFDASHVQAEHVEEGTFWVPRYSFQGWILERWLPPTSWGSRAAWEQTRTDDGTSRLLGPYPENGDYWMLAGPWSSIDEAGDLRAAIRDVNRATTQNPVNWELHVRTQLALEKAQREDRIRDFETQLEAHRKAELLPTLQSTSKAAQRVRNAALQMVGKREHAGASAAWND